MFPTDIRFRLRVAVERRRMATTEWWWGRKRCACGHRGNQHLIELGHWFCRSDFCGCPLWQPRRQWRRALKGAMSA
jgi:hypothetical protein